MSGALRIALETEPIERAESALAAAGFFEGDRPLRGAASRADWRLCGMVSALLAAGRLRGAAGEALLVPSDRRLRAPRLLLVGLGSASRFGAAEVAEAVGRMVERALDLGVRSVALAIPGDWTGAVPVRPAAEASARGAIEVLARRGGSLALRLLVPEAGAARALRGLEAAASRARAAGVAFELPDLAPERVPPGGAPAAERGRRPISPAPGRP